MVSNHIVKSYDDDLEHLKAELIKMSQKVIEQLGEAVQSVIEHDSALAQKVIDKDPEIDQLECDIDSFVVRIIALRQPVAQDLRSVVAALKISSHLERVADYARNISRRTIFLTDMPHARTGSILKHMVTIVQEMIQQVLEAYVHTNLEQANQVWLRDREVDEIYTSYLRELLTYMMEDPRNIGPCTQLLFAAKNIERAGDHASDIAELVHYHVYGTPFREPNSSLPPSL